MQKVSSSEKVRWQGAVLSVQPRIRLTRSFDERSHTYLGYILHVRGSVGDEERACLVAVGKGAHDKHGFRAGDVASGEAHPIADPRTEIAELYKASKLKVSRGEGSEEAPPPWHGTPPPLALYRERGHRRLAKKTYESKCATCIWGAKMAVEMIIDHWNPSQVRYRTETFCYGPLSCSLYKAGPTRKVPGRRGMSYEEQDWVDEEATAHRAPDD